MFGSRPLTSIMWDAMFFRNAPHWSWCRIWSFTRTTRSWHEWIIRMCIMSRHSRIRSRLLILGIHGNEFVYHVQKMTTVGKIVLMVANQKADIKEKVNKINLILWTNRFVPINQIIHLFGADQFIPSRSNCRSYSSRGEFIKKILKMT